ncbi:hypothetical protein [Sorangium sp. So ce1335]|uniref:hypothetical protein n=1 Tax=Sorangium sp. So ce1335 TaxID=3133335 RepID=UPI003F615718
MGLVEERRHELVALLGRVWPEWGEVLTALTARGLAPTPDGWSELEDAQRAEGLPQLPDQLNRRTAAALVAPHSKATLTDRRQAALGDAEATHDGSVRLVFALPARTRGERRRRPARRKVSPYVLSALSARTLSRRTRSAEHAETWREKEAVPRIAPGGRCSLCGQRNSHDR